MQSQNLTTFIYFFVMFQIKKYLLMQYVINWKQNKTMSQDSRYKLTTIQRLAPSLEQIDFMLTKTALEQKIQSLNFSVSIDKIQSRTFNVFDLGVQDKFQLESDIIQVPYTTREKSKSHQICLNSLTKQDKLLRQSDKIQLFSSKQKKKLNFEHVDIKNRFSKLASTASTIKNVSPNRGNSPSSILGSTMNRTKKSITLKIKPQVKKVSKLNQAQKYAPYLQGKKTKKSIMSMRMSNRDKNLKQKMVSIKK